MRKLEDSRVNWDVVPKTLPEIEGYVLQVNEKLQRLYETRILASEKYNEMPDAEKLVEVVNAQIEIYERDAEVLARVQAVTELIEDVSKMPGCELPPRPSKTLPPDLSTETDLGDAIVKMIKEVGAEVAADAKKKRRATRKRARKPKDTGNENLS